ncbi:hypothetical protein [Halococcus sp. IIIV-5B]|uniref:hypothetical protein n=1 Tax=Halococcus sp. IIIV-5B TaxID=2321230 RepID=UPI0011C397FF|nr:hypothetical protein [Halococcus sp. IIIV-5B]
MAPDERPLAMDELSENDILFDHDEDEHYVVDQISPRGITLLRRDREYYIPHTIFAEWYTTADVGTNDDTPSTRPGWID